MSLSIQTIKKTILALLGLLIAGIALMACLYTYMYLHLPDVDTLKNVQLQVPLRIYSKDGKLIAQYGEKRRTPVKLKEVPDALVRAILATEDQRYYEHPGVDLIGLGRAILAVVSSGRKSQGASTITMQVARNFFLSRKKTYSRKINEILLAIKIESHFDKEKILELYLNKIYLGHRAYGVAAAAEVYYGKSLKDLSLAQLAMIAGLPQAPSRDNPISNPDAAKDRRDHVLARLLDNDYINQETYEKAIAEPLVARYHGRPIEVNAPYVAEMVRAAMVDVYGKDTYIGGFNVYTTIDSTLQQAANDALSTGLENYDSRHGYRGAIANWGTPSNEAFEDWQKQLSELPKINHLQPAAVIVVADKTATAMLNDGNLITLPWEGLSWAQYKIQNRYMGPKPQIAADVVKPGDVIYVRNDGNDKWRLSQVPEVEGALVAIDPQDGAVEALTGGYSYAKNSYNRATQAKRQPGSVFKPFIYSAALAKGYTLATVINDAPVFLEDNSVDQYWRPHNSNEKFNGPTSLRDGIVRSRNLVSIRLLREIGVNYAINYLHRFGYNDEALPNSLTLALGSGSLTPMQLTAAYSVFANGGYRVKPYFINTIERNNGEIVYQEHPLMVCEQCESDELFTSDADHDDILPAPRVITPQNSYLITNALIDVIKHGTGRSARALNRTDLAGKTGTTNKKIDAWFAGYNSDIVTTVWVGFDKPITLNEYGAKAALPIWIDFMRAALKGKPNHTLTQPSDITNVRIDPTTGLLARPNQKNARFEIFRQKYAPTKSSSNDTAASKQTLDDDSDVAELF